MDISGYSFQLAADETFDNMLIDVQDITETSFRPELKLKPGEYYWRVATKDKEGEVGPFSDHQQFRRSPDGPDISASELDTSEMVFRWREGAGISKYRCQISSDEKFSTIVADEVVTEPHYSFSDLNYGTYFIRVAAIDTDGYQGPFSPPQKAQIPAPQWIAWLMAAPILLLILL